MPDMGLLKPDDKSTKLRLAEPLRHLAAKHTPLGFGAGLALTGNDQHEAQAFAVRPLQKGRQRAMRARLRHAVKVKTRLDLFAAARQF